MKIFYRLRHLNNADSVLLHPVAGLLILLGLAMLALTQGIAVALPIGEILMLIGLFLLFFGAGVYIAAVLGTLGLLAGLLFSDRPFWLFMGQVIWAPSSSFVLVAVPLFLLMGEILLRSGLSGQLYKALNIWLRRLPGGLLHTNIASCAVFLTVCLPGLLAGGACPGAGCGRRGRYGST